MIPITNISTMNKIICKVETLERSLIRANEMLNSERYIKRRIGFGEKLCQILIGLKKHKKQIEDDILYHKNLFNEHIGNCQSFSHFKPLN